MNSRKTIYKQNENANKEIENIRTNQIEILELKTIITKLRNSLESSVSDLIKQKKIMSELRDNWFQIIQSEEQKEKGIKKEWRKPKGLNETPLSETTYALWESKMEKRERKEKMLI